MAHMCLDPSQGKIMIIYAVEYNIQATPVSSNLRGTNFFYDKLSVLRGIIS